MKIGEVECGAVKHSAVDNIISEVSYFPLPVEGVAGAEHGSSSWRSTSKQVN